MEQQLKRKFIGVAALAFVAALSAGVATANLHADADAWQGFEITATAVRTKSPSGLRFRTVATNLTPELMAQNPDAQCYTTVTFTASNGTSYSTDVPVTVWRNDGEIGWNTVLLDIPESDYATEITAQSFIKGNGFEYETKAVTTSIAKTAAKVMNQNGAIDDVLNAYVTGVESVTLDATATAFVGEVAQINATVAPVNYAVVWSSANPDIIKVNENGQLVGVSAGTATVTATVGGKSATCAVTVYNKHKIASAADFKALMSSDASALAATEYYVLTNDIDFSGIVVNETEGYQTIGKNAALEAEFKATIDGNGHAIKNLTLVTNPDHLQDAKNVGASFIYLMGGTIKNLSATMTVQTASQHESRYGGFAAYLRAGAFVSNCHFDITSTYSADKNWPVAPFSGINGSGSGITVENVISIVHEFTGSATADFASGLIGRIAAGGDKVYVNNCFVVEEDPRFDSAPEYCAQGTAQVTNTVAYSTLASMYAAAKTGMTADKGWNSFWSVDAESETIKFGDVVVYNGKLPQLNVVSQDLFLVSGNNNNNVPTSMQLEMLYTNKAATFVSSNDAVATVAADGTVTAVGAGTATITATTSEGTYTCDVNVYNYHEIARAADFKALMSSNASALAATEYYMLANDIDFSGIVVNETEGYQTIGKNAALEAEFKATIDGNGHAIKNLTLVTNPDLLQDGKNVGASFIYLMGGTIKNLSATMTVQTASQHESRYGGFAAYLRAGAFVSNCHFDITSTYSADKNWPVAPFSGINGSGSGITVENVISIVHGFTGSATADFASGLIGRIAAGGDKVYINNCFVVEENPRFGSAPEYCAQGTAKVTNTVAYSTLASMYAAAKTGMTPDKGWNSLWSIDEVSETIKFGDVVVYNGKWPQLAKTSEELFIVSGANNNNVPTSMQLEMLYTNKAATFVSSNDAVATVDENGVVTAVGVGSATITATVDGITSTCKVTVYNYHEIATVEDFKPLMALANVDTTEYYMLAGNIDFTGITLNQTPDYSTLCYGGGSGWFKGVLDGNGYAIENVSIAPVNGSMFAAFIYQFSGTVKNLACEMTLVTTNQDTTRYGGFVCAARGAVASNCYFDLTSPYDVAVNNPVSPYASMFQNGSVVENCVGVLHTITNKGATGTASGLIGRIDGNDNTCVIRNCYAVEMDPIDGNAGYKANPTNFTQKTLKEDVNNQAFDSLASMYAAAKTGMTAENGWNSFWSVDATNGTLKFGDLVVYEAE